MVFGAVKVRRGGGGGGGLVLVKAAVMSSHHALSVTNYRADRPI